MEDLKGIFVGDQSPWCGGLLRLHTLQTMYGDKHDISYFLQDADLPWRKEDLQEPRLRQQWPSYWSLAVRHCWAPETPDGTLNAVRDSLKTPRGLTYLAGGKTNTVIWGHTEGSPLPDLLSRLHDEEYGWLQKLGEVAGVPVNLPSMPRSSAREFSNYCASYTFGEDTEVESVVEFFRENPPLSFEVLPKEYFWEITRAGERYHYPANACSRPVFVPKGAALLLEFALRGVAIGCTGLSYLEEAQKLRDRYVPGLPIRILKITFSWEPSADVFGALLEEFRKRKEKRGQSVVIPEDTVEKIREYWRGRPTSFAYMAFGGDLNPSVEHIVL